MKDPRFTDERIIVAAREMGRKVAMATLALTQESNLRGQARTETVPSIVAIAAPANTDASTFNIAKSNTDATTVSISKSDTENLADNSSSSPAPGNSLIIHKPDAFKFFKKLPAEIQLKIWKEATAQGQTITIVGKTVVFNLFAHPASSSQQVHAKIAEGGHPGILRACKDSRKEALKVYELCSYPLFKNPVYFAVNLDTVQLKTEKGKLKTMEGSWVYMCEDLTRFLSRRTRLAHYGNEVARIHDAYKQREAARIKDA